MTLAIEVEKISKQYQLGSYFESSGSLREILANPMRGMEQLKKYFSSAHSDSQNKIWAVKDLSFSMQKGEIVGIIGKNGSGKSTLLKILSRITHPTQGKIKIYGKFASLLEVGTGFHLDLTGRENIFLNGSLLGMSKKQIQNKFDEIVEFSELGKFIDTPVKRYSSGMYVRLAFAVAAHLDREVVIIDEVLAVGDLAFQRKCLSKIVEAREKGQATILVTHNMITVREFCSRAILMESGRFIADGDPTSVIRTYYDRLKKDTMALESSATQKAKPHSSAAQFTEYRIYNTDGLEKYDFRRGESFQIKISYQVHRKIPNLVFVFALLSEISEEFLTSTSYVLSESSLEAGKTGSATIECRDLCLMPRNFYPYLWLGTKEGGSFDRIDYRNDYCSTLEIQSEEAETQIFMDGYFYLNTRLVQNRLLS